MKSGLVSILVAAAVALGGCHAPKRLTKANVDEVAEGMSKKQVESILGPPTAIETTEVLGLKKTTYTYKQGSDSVTIVFRDEKVAAKESTLHD